MINDMDFLWGVFIGLLLVVLAVIENNQSVEPLHWNKAVDLCKGNKGVQKVSMDIEDIQVQCLNGARFDTTKTKVESEK